MAIFYKITSEKKAGEGVDASEVIRWSATPGEAEAIKAKHGGKVERIEADDVEARLWATNWLNASEVKRAAAKKREAAKSSERASEIAAKVWAKRRANGTDKRNR